MTAYMLTFSLGMLFVATAAWRTARAKTYLSAHLILAVVMAYTLYLPTFDPHEVSRNDFDFSFLLFGAGVSILAAVVIIKPVVPSAIKATTHLRADLLFLGAATYTCWLLLATLTRLYTFGGIVPALSVSRLDSYLKGGITSPTLEFLLTVPQILFYVAMGTLINQRKYVLFSSLVLLLSFYLLLHANTRLPILFPSLAAGLVLINRHWGKHTERYLIPVMSIGIVLVFLGSYVGAFIRTGRIGEIGVASVDSMITQNRGQLGYHEWLYDLFCFYKIHPSAIEYGESLWYYPVASLIPRYFWQAKPLTSISNRLTESVYGLKVGEGTEIFTFTLIGEGISQFGYIGSLLWCPLFLFMVTRCERHILRFSDTEYLHSMFLMNMIPFVRAELPVVRILVTVITLTIVTATHRPRFSLNARFRADAGLPHLHSELHSHRSRVARSRYHGPLRL